MGDWSVNILLFYGENYDKSHQIKSNYKVLRKNEVDMYGAPVFAPDLVTLF
jgi:hypothetical protein